jgi:hypothetical protein
MTPAAPKLSLSTVIAGAMIVLTIWDVFAEYPWQPFAGQTVFNVCFMVASFIVLFMVCDAWEGNRKPSLRKRTSVTTRRSSQPVSRHRPQVRHEKPSTVTSRL